MKIEIEPGVRPYVALGIEPPIVWGQSFGGMVAQRDLARHPTHPAKVILTSCSPHLGVERKLEVCLPLYNPTLQPDTAGARARFDTVLLDTWNRTELPGVNLLPGLAMAVCPVLVRRFLGATQQPRILQ